MATIGIGVPQRGSHGGRIGPYAIPSLRFAVESQFLTGADGSQVTQWNDLTKYGNHLTPKATFNAPLVKQNGPEFNNQKGVLFQATPGNQYLYSTSWNFTSLAYCNANGIPNDRGTWIVAYTLNSFTQGYGVPVVTPGPSASGGLAYDGGNFLWYYHSGAYIFATTPRNNYQGCISAHTYNGSIAPDDRRLRQYFGTYATGLMQRPSTYSNPVSFTTWQTTAAGLSVGSSGVANSFMDGQIFALFYFSADLSDNERNSVYNYIFKTYFKKLPGAAMNQVLCYGDNITNGNPSNTSMVQPPNGTSDSYPCLLQAKDTVNWKVIKQGTANFSLAQLNTPGTTLANAYVVKSDMMPRDIIIIQGGQRDFFNSVALATVQSNMVALCQRFKYTYRWPEVWACTMTAYNGTSGTYTEANRQAFNAWLRANYYQFCDGVIDVGGATPIGDTPNFATYFAADQFNLNQAGMQVFADTAWAALQTVPVPMTQYLLTEDGLNHFITEDSVNRLIA